MFTAKVSITLKESVLDPQGQTVKKALSSMGEELCKDVRVGKYIEIKLDTKSKAEAETITKRICDQLLVNPVVETYSSIVE